MEKRKERKQQEQYFIEGRRSKKIIKRQSNQVKKQPSKNCDCWEKYMLIHW